VQLPDTFQADRWSGFRGGLLNGVSPSGNLPVRFGRHQGVRWKQRIPGRGNSSPTVWGDRVLLTTQRGGAEGPVAVWCLDRHTGTLRWRRELETPRGSTHAKNGHATPTPATDGRRVFAAVGAQGVFCLDMNGQLLWHAPLDGAAHRWGHAASPVLVGDLVIQLVDGDKESWLVALDRYSGEQRWRTPRQSAGCWSTPTLVRVSGDPRGRWELVVNGTGSPNGSPGCVIAYDPLSGEPLWQVHGTTDIPCPSPIVGAGLVISTSGPNGPVMAIRPGGQGDVRQTHVVWQREWGGPYVPTGLISGDRLYILSDGGLLECLDPRDGQTIWKERLHRTHSASLVAGDGKVYAVSERGDVHVVADRREFELLAVNRLDERCLATPAIAEHQLFVRTRRHLYCFTADAAQLADAPATESDAEVTSMVSSESPPPELDTR
jgi:outer membrane protein assembly factor BamB